VSTSLTRNRGLTACLIGLAIAASGCGGGGGGSTSQAAAGGSPAAHSSVSAVTSSAASAPIPSLPVAATKKVTAKGGGDFCTLIATATNSEKNAGTDAASVKAQISAAQGQEKQALDLAPSSIKADAKLLFDASNAMYAALEKDGYDYSKLTADDMSALGTPAVAAAEKRLKAYTTDVCKIS
jgi:hypothetical protein